MKSRLLIVTTLASSIAFGLQVLPASSRPPVATSGYIGFDRNDYPGDANLKALRRTFAYSGYWLNNPPGENANSWRGKRKNLEAAGFGFLVLFNGRTYAEIKSAGNAANVGAADAAKLSRLRVRKVFHPTPSSSSIRSKVDDFSWNSAPIFTPGSMVLPPRTLPSVFTALESEHRKAAESP